MAFGNLEYQSMDMTRLADYPQLINAMTHVTVFWELFYCALVWPRLTRPVVLLLAIPLHLGIAICLGMVTFGLAMLIGNMAFLPPGFVRALWPPLTGNRDRRGRAGESRRPAATKAPRQSLESSHSKR
jgi:hypothetical protein